MPLLQGNSTGLHQSVMPSRNMPQKRNHNQIIAFYDKITYCFASVGQMGFEGRDRSRSPRRDGGGPPARSFDDGGGGGGFRGGGGGGGGGDGDGCKLYVGNLAFSTQGEDMRQYFGQVDFTICLSVFLLRFQLFT